MSLRRRQLQSVVRELVGVVLVVCASLLPALAAEPIGDDVGRVESQVARGERDAGLVASVAVRVAPARLVRLRDIAWVVGLPLAQLDGATRWLELAADGGDGLRPVPCLRWDRYWPRSDCADEPDVRRG